MQLGTQPYHNTKNCTKNLRQVARKLQQKQSHSIYFSQSRNQLPKFHILVTVHLGIILINNQLDTQFLLYIFISILYVFRATLCSSSGEPIVSLQRLVYVTLCR